MREATRILLASRQAETLKELIDSQAGHLDVEILTDASRLFAQLAEQRYALLVIDQEMVRGRQPQSRSVLWQLAAVCPETGVLLLTTPAQRREAVERLQQGALDYLLLPADPTEINLRLNRCLELQRLRLLRPEPVEPYPINGQQLQRLTQITREITQTLQLNEALEIIIAKAQQETAASLVSIWLTDQRGILRRRSINRTWPNEAPADLSKVEPLLFKLVIQTALSLEVVTATLPGRVTFNPNQPPLAWAVLLPLAAGEKFVGVLAIARSAPEPLPEETMHWLAMFGQQAAIGLENARLFHDLSSAYVDLAQSREEIQRNRHTLNVIFEAVTDGLYILNSDMSIEAMNGVEAARLGVTLPLLPGQDFLGLLSLDADAELVLSLREALETGREITWIAPEEENEPLLQNREFRIYPIRNRLAHTEQVVIFAQDLSERRRWQASLFRSANLAAVGQLAGSVAHQINNPLTVTMTNSQLLMLDIPAQTEANDLAQGIFKAGERIQAIVSNLLEFSNQEEYSFATIPLQETIDSALVLVTNSLRKAKIRLEIDYQTWPNVRVSISHMKLVWVNLLLNARDAVANHAAEPGINIITRLNTPNQVAVSISDNGVGLTTEQRANIFRPFYTTKSPGKGLGLGLYSAHIIVEHHQGQITVESHPNQGATFTVTLPIVE